MWSTEIKAVATRLETFLEENFRGLLKVIRNEQDTITSNIFIEAIRNLETVRIHMISSLLLPKSRN